MALSRDESLQVVAEAADGTEALRLVLQHKPDLLLLDVSMPGLTSDQVILRAKEAVPELKTLILTAHDEEVYVRMLTKVPISGYLLKDEAPENLLQAIRCIRQGAVWFSQSVASRMMGLTASQAERIPFDLTVRELEVLEGIARGEDNVVIAQRLNLAEQTVRNYVSTLYSKIGVPTRVMAAVWARERGIQ